MARPDPLDDLFRPSVADAPRPSARPWRVRSQFVVAFFGGIFSVLAIAWLNAGRLGLDARALAPRMIGTALGTWTFVTLGAAAAIWAGWVDDDTMRLVRWAYKGAALLVYLEFARMQEPADRRWAATSDGEHASLWIAGFAAIVGGSLVQGVATVAVLGIVSLALELPL